MTTDLRERLADEIYRLEPLDDLAPAALRQGRARLRRRRGALGAVGALAVGAIVAGTAWVGVGDAPGDGTTPVAGPPSAGAAATDAEVEWAQRLAQVFAAHLPAGFAPEVRQDPAAAAVSFLATGPTGSVQLNATVHLGSTLAEPSCDDTEARQCRLVRIPGGRATVLRDAYPRPDLPEASQVFVRQHGAQTIVNVVENSLGGSQFTMGDLVELARADDLGEAIAFAAEHAGELHEPSVPAP